MMLPDRAYSVMIVEDERIVAMDLQQSLTGMGYDAFAIASSADEAVARASERRPDVVLMDIRIKGKRDGIEAAEILGSRFGIPVVFLTAHADDATVERAKKTEPFAYLLKPLKSGELRSAIEISLCRHELEKRLRERERWFSTTLRSIADAVIAVDRIGKITFMNPVAEQIAGVTAGDALGRPVRDVLRLLDPAHPCSPLDEVLARGKTAAVREATLELATGASRIISESAAPVVDDDRVLGAVMVFRDITEQKLSQKQLELSERLASLGTMAAGVAHEVNNPLAVVVANASFVRDGMTQRLSELRNTRGSVESIRSLEELLEAQSEIQSAASRIGIIIADLKAFSRPAPHTQGQADVARSVEWAIRSTSRELWHRARVVIDLADVPPVALDETRLGQILVNLLLNAAQAISPGNVDGNEVRVIARATGDGSVVIEVRDTGCGMAPDVAGRVFEPFFTTKPVGVGTGLGLSICHGIASSVGGKIRVQSRVGAGSVFRLALPFAPPNEPPKPFISAPGADRERRGRILVIDDDDMVLRVVRRILQKHDLTCMESARKALELIESGKTFDIIFSDIMMPDMTGMEFFDELTKVRPAEVQRVVFLTGGVMTPGIANFLASIPNLRFEKPFEVKALQMTVQRLLAARDALLSP
jgi:PAS domain S-box-containing protein